MREEQSDNIEQEVPFGCGIRHRSLGVQKYSYELTSLDSLKRSTMRPSKLEPLACYNNWVEPLEAFKNGVEGGLVSPSRSPWQSFH